MNRLESDTEKCTKNVAEITTLVGQNVRYDHRNW